MVRVGYGAEKLNQKRTWYEARLRSREGLTRPDERPSPSYFAKRLDMGEWIPGRGTGPLTIGFPVRGDLGVGKIHINTVILDVMKDLPRWRILQYHINSSGSQLRGPADNTIRPRR